MLNTQKRQLVWEDWRSQLKHRITTVEQLREWVTVTPEEEEAIAQCEGKYRWSITPYYASLMDRNDPSCPIRQQAIPQLGEFKTFANASEDPVGDTEYRKTNRVVHKYPDRVIMLVTEACAVYCRHCTRKYHTTDLEGTYFEQNEALAWDQDFRYIHDHPEIRDVLLTGGDPLTYGDEKLEWIIAALRKIPHVEIIRIGSRYPVLLPQRITPEFCQMLDRYHPIWLNTHFNHGKEITPASAQACDRLLRHGVVVQNQTVLLKGINDNLKTMRDLLKKLLKIRVRPYYLYHCDNVTGVSHFVPTIETGRAIMRGLQGYMTGFAVPQYIITTKLGKIPLSEQQVHQQEKGYLLENYRGQTMTLYEDL
ncbi:arginine 2,3-aminomutase [Spirulina subsalsa FACHB-351]|uniref:Arginine 2,3-aminomutase n=1 Tax=Spirulina subsalsa FACHB-351 TaxID=234711 RepID=A0ABT3L4J8_9CYAN|nr:arginine 2,3-aminomutase [Spirulina subsalsa]MCW6036428.1 arginine 2,3-aminomutase [Spirulina subsalsa FACHB-351]